MADTYLDRRQAAEYITAKGLPYSPNTLQKLATVGGGPVYRRFGNRAVYTVSDLEAWIAAKLTPPRASTSGKAA